MTNENENPGLTPIEKFCQQPASDESPTVQSQSNVTVTVELPEPPKPTLKERVKNALLVTMFVLMWVWIGAVSAVDTALAVHYRTTLKHGEENPINRLILAADGWQVSRFVAIKMMCTILVLGILVVIYNTGHRKHAYIIGVALAAFQALLLLYMLAT